MKSAPDGYTIVIVSNAHFANPILTKSLPYNTVRDLAPIRSGRFNAPDSGNPSEFAGKEREGSDHACKVPARIAQLWFRLQWWIGSFGGGVVGIHGKN